MAEKCTAKTEATCSVVGCGNKQASGGLCGKHLYRNRVHGNPYTTKTVYGNPKDRILCSIEKDKETGCWNWSGVLTKNGYGRTTHKDRPISAHRLSYLIFNGEIPAGMCVLHRCDNRRCVNPDHLFLGTHRDNMVDMKSKGRSPVPWQKGLTLETSEKLSNAINKATTVRAKNYLNVCRDVYERKNKTKETYKELRDVYGVCERQLFDRYKKYQKHLEQMWKRFPVGGR